MRDNSSSPWVHNLNILMAIASMATAVALVVVKSQRSAAPPPLFPPPMTFALAGPELLPVVEALPTLTSRPALLETDRRAFLERQAEMARHPELAVSPPPPIEGSSLVDFLRLVMGHRVERAAFSGDGRYLAVIPENAAAGGDVTYEVLLYDLAGNVKLVHRFAQDARPTAVGLSWFGDRMVVGREDGRVIAYDTDEGEVLCEQDVRPYRSHYTQSTRPRYVAGRPAKGEETALVTGIAVSPGGEFAALAFGRVLVLDLKKGELLRSASPQLAARQVSLSHDGRFLAVGEVARGYGAIPGPPACGVEELASGRLHPVGEGRSSVSVLGWGRDPARLVMIDVKGRVHTWEQGEAWSERQLPEGSWPTMLAVSPDGGRIATVGKGERDDEEGGNFFAMGRSYFGSTVQLTEGRDVEGPETRRWGVGRVVKLRFMHDSSLMLVTNEGRLFVIPWSYQGIASEMLAEMAAKSLFLGSEALEEDAAEFGIKPLRELAQEEVGDLLVLVASARGLGERRSSDGQVFPDPRKKVIERLMSYGASMNHRAGEAKWTALHWAAFTDDAGMVMHLLGIGADFAIGDAHGRTPAMIAEQAGSRAAAGVLRFGDD